MVVGNAFRAFLRESGVAGGTSFEEAAAPARASLERRLARIARTSTVVLVVVVAIEIALLVAAAVLVVVAPDRGEALQKVGAANLFNLPVALGVLASFARRKSEVDTVLAILPVLSSEQIVTVAEAMLRSSAVTSSRSTAPQAG